MSYLNELNEVQRASVEATEGASMILAGAGSGKTRVLTYRIVHLIHSGVDAHRIMSLTFTNKAAKEMKARITSALGSSEGMNVWMGTFHSIFAKILRIEAEKIGYPSNFTIYDSDDSLSLIRSIVKEFNLDDKVYKASLVFNRISSAKNNLLSAEEYNRNSTIQSEDLQSKKPHLGKIYNAYALRCFRSGAMDFDDLLYKTNILFRDFTDVLAKYQNRFKYILVDEFQDTNFAQYMIVKKLTAKWGNICVVGDDAQSIYAFRGANIQNILNFKKDFPNTQTFKLEQNYRSTKHIVSAANSVIEKNKNQFKKDVWTDNDSGEKVAVFKASTDNEEGAIIAEEIYNTKIENQKFNKDFAILYRTNSQSRAIEEALRKKNIAYRIYGGLSFYKRKEIKDLISYLRLTVNPKDEEALKRVINYPARGIGKTTLDKITLASNQNNLGMWEIIKKIDSSVNINKGTAQRIKDFILSIETFGSMVENTDAFTLATHIAKSSGLLKDLYTDKTPEGLARYENIQELLNGLKDFVETNKKEEDLSIYLDAYLQEISLLTDNKENVENEDSVSLMTIHASKGLEFPYVFIVGLEENLFPSQLSVGSRDELEEERRLFYVALTRAEIKATITYSTSRYRWGNLVYNEPSRFIKDLDENLVEFKNIHQLNSKRKQKIASTNMGSSIPKKKLVSLNKTRTSTSTFKSDNLAQLAIGNSVEHAKFGIGNVLHIEGSPDNRKAVVFFKDVGQKQLLLKFAKLKILS